MDCHVPMFHQWNYAFYAFLLHRRNNTFNDFCITLLHQWNNVINAFIFNFVAPME